MRQTLSFKQKYQAIVNKDGFYEGIFITAVKTTKIFCRSSCTARKPKIENVIFYDDIHEAILNGYRPCKVCKPMEPAGETPVYVREVLKKLQSDPFLKIKDYDLVLCGIAPNTMRRWFKKHYNMTFQAYQRMLRINTAYHKISSGASVTATAFDTGFASLSGFNSSYQNIFGKPPTHLDKKNAINIIRFVTPLGPMFGCATSKGICLLEFTNRKMLETEFKDIAKRLDAVILPGVNKHLEALEKQIAEYFEGKRKTFTVLLHTPGTDFQNSVWKMLQEIPYGQVRSYEEQAMRMGNLKAVRAIASANGYNRISIVIPCHRVLGKNGDLTGYGGGLERKKWLLDFERKNTNT